MRVILGLCLMAVFGVQAAAAEERVFVKYRGIVDLAPFDCHATSSSLVNRLCYWKEKEYLVVLLGVTYYHYCRVPLDVVKDWLSADSKGQFYTARVKGRFDCRLGGVPE